MTFSLYPAPSINLQHILLSWHLNIVDWHYYFPEQSFTFLGWLSVLAVGTTIVIQRVFATPILTYKWGHSVTKNSANKLWAGKQNTLCSTKCFCELQYELDLKVKIAFWVYFKALTSIQKYGKHLHLCFDEFMNTSPEISSRNILQPFL